jgi:beta-lactam-binding protein with PASTA domain
MTRSGTAANEWPQPLPNAVGKQLDDITGQSPEEGTLVAENETVTVQVSR